MRTMQTFFGNGYIGVLKINKDQRSRTKGQKCIAATEKKLVQAELGVQAFSLPKLAFHMLACYRIAT